MTAGSTLKTVFANTSQHLFIHSCRYFFLFFVFVTRGTRRERIYLKLVKNLFNAFKERHFKMQLAIALQKVSYLNFVRMSLQEFSFVFTAILPDRMCLLRPNYKCSSSQSNHPRFLSIYRRNANT